MLETKKPSIGAVLPIRCEGYRDDMELGRAELLLESLDRFCDRGLLSSLIAVVPDAESSFVSNHLNQWKHLGLMVLPEEELLPELARFPDVRGWRKQQLLKLAACKCVDTDFIITLDSDVVCTHFLTKDVLLPSGRALLDLEPRHVFERWWRGSARVLGVPPELTQPGISVTPAIFSVRACKELIAFLDTRSANLDWVSLLLKPFRQYDLRRILGYSKFFISWTENTLYYLYCESRGYLNQFHVISGTPVIPQHLISKHSVWRSVSFEDWDPSIVFSEHDHALFCVIQGNKQIDPREIAGRVRPFFASHH